MVQRSSSKTAAIAGTLAGLLAAGLAAYYLHGQRAAQPAGKPVAVVASAGGAPAPAARAGALSREQAVAALMALPELRAWSERIEKNSGGKARGAVMEYDPEPREVKGKRYYQLSFIENSADAATRWESFLVALPDGEILVDDDDGGEALTLDAWRATRQPLLRAGPRQ
ncbi:hypothetical protein [Pseudoduganella namucuonensis]|uniref:Uncharacterized protein n=1 Tax=Pseudoduganella namucuonensis TaxID=1035707 RepID=A0A1I7FI45_9BURK|nr:hypothetical protein [Pseudoduganella namucuonensis]SFU35882.1 hypothetical protein SAMN05216552_100257 [Pseudoduganella namucuonensis]